MCQNFPQDSDDSSSSSKSGEVKHEDYSSFLSCTEVPQLSPVSIMSERFVYLRKNQQGNRVTLSSEEAPPIIRRSGEDCLSIVSSDTPVREIHESEDANEKLHMPSIEVLKSESIDRCSPVKELDTDKISQYSDKKFVYRRKTPQGRYIGVLSSEAPCLSVLSQNDHSHLDPFISSSLYKRGNHEVEEEESNEASKSTRQKTIEVDSINDSCSSSKSYTELVSSSIQTELDDSVEYSSSSVKVREFLDEVMSEKDLCISLLRSQGVINGTSPSKNRASDEGVLDITKSKISRLCKICSHLEYTHKMLICDNCEEAFHLLCCNPRVKKIPVDDWFCHSCSKKRHKILTEGNSACPYVIGGEGRCVSSSIEESNLILLMVRDTGAYSSGVPCGKGFQAEVAEWSGPITNDTDEIPEPLELDQSDFINSIDLDLNNKSKVSSITNWLQCREVLDDGRESDDETICGKWRRAPLFEVQTDKWECFCCVGWDPIHADCAVPQELVTNQVLKQLKYIQTLRPRLDAKRLEHMKKDNDDLTKI